MKTVSVRPFGARTRHGTRVNVGFAITLAAILAHAGCGDSDPNSDDDGSDGQETGSGDTDGSTPTDGSTDPEDPACLDNEAYFKQKVWSPILKTKCLLCHNRSGLARESGLVLVESDWGPTYMEENQRIVTEVALDEREGVSRLLLKPSAQIEHEGGAQIEQDGAEYQAIAEFVRRIKAPVECPGEDDALEEAFSEIELLSAEATLRKAALNLVGRLPSQGELSAVQGGSMEELDNMLEGMMSEEAFYDRLLDMLNDFFLTDRYMRGQDALSLLDRDDYPNAFWFDVIEDDNERNTMRRYTNDAVAREALELIAHIVRERRSFTEVLTADYMVVSPFSALAYGVSPSFNDATDPNEFVEARIPGIPHAGVLTSSMIMNRFPTTATNRNRHRARKVFEFFLATDVEALASRPIDPTLIADHNPTLNNPNCSICHANIDPVAGALQNWDERGRYRPLSDGWFPEMTPPGFNEAILPSDQVTAAARWLGTQIVSDKRFSISIVHMVYRMLTGQMPLLEPSDEADPHFANKMRAYELQTEYFSNIAEQFAGNGFEIRHVFRELIRSPYYRAAESNVLSGNLAITFDELGGTRFLTPEQLHLKIIATTGYPWRPNANGQDYLLATNWYRIFYGGIDSDGVIERITAPNGIMANVAARMSNEMSCWTTARDFSLPASERRLFPFAERTFVPEDENGFLIPAAAAAIKTNIQHLYKRILGEDLELEDPEIERAFTLFREVWRDGQMGIEGEYYSTYLPGACRSTRDFWTNDELPEEQRIQEDREYTVRAWMAVMTYLLSDYRFLHE